MEALFQSVSMNAPFAVRSSAVQDDMPEASFARRYITHLNVIGTVALERACSRLGVRTKPLIAIVVTLTFPVSDQGSARFTIVLN